MHALPRNRYFNKYEATCSTQDALNFSNLVLFILKIHLYKSIFKHVQK